MRVGVSVSAGLAERAWWWRIRVTLKRPASNAATTVPVPTLISSARAKTAKPSPASTTIAVPRTIRGRLNHSVLRGQMLMAETIHHFFVMAQAAGLLDY